MVRSRACGGTPPGWIREGEGTDPGRSRQRPLPRLFRCARSAPATGPPAWRLPASAPFRGGSRAADLARRLKTEVQYFSTHRIVEAHAWGRAHPEGLGRAYVFVGESGERC
jgi:hypothetical protein